MSLSVVDYAIIVCYFIGVVLVSRVKHRTLDSNLTTYILGGRKLTLPFFIASLVATWYGSIIGVGEFIYRNGILGWVCFGLPYYITAFVYARYLSRRIRIENVLTIPQLLSVKIDPRLRSIAGLLLFVLILPASFLRTLTIILTEMLGLSEPIAVAMACGLTLIVVYRGGFMADVRTNALQFGFMYLGMSVLLIFTVIRFGSPFSLTPHLPASHLSILGTEKVSFVIGWWLLALQNFIDPSFFQRVSALKDQNSAERALYLSIACWIVFDTMTLLCGLYARAHFAIDPTTAFTALAQGVLPHFALGIFAVALLSIVMSSLESYTLLAASTLTIDIFSPVRIFGSVRAIRIASLVVLALSALISFSIHSPIDLMWYAAVIAVPGLLLPTIICLLSKPTYMHPIATIVIPSVVSVALLLVAIVVPSVQFKPEPLLSGLVISIVLHLLFVRTHH